MPLCIGSLLTPRVWFEKLGGQSRQHGQIFISQSGWREKREKSDEPWASWESLSKISVFLHKVCVNSFVYLRIGFLGEEISL